MHQYRETFSFTLRDSVQKRKTYNLGSSEKEEELVELIEQKILN